MLDQTEKDKARQILKELRKGVTLNLLRHKDRQNGLYAELNKFAHQLADLSDCVTVEERFVSNEYITPAINITGPSRQNMYYAALPQGAELILFLKTIVRLGNGQISLKEDTLSRLQALNHKIALEVLITKSCPICPRMVELVSQFALASSEIKAWIIDVDYFPHIIQKHHATSAPTTVINNRGQIVGTVNEQELLNWIEKIPLEAKNLLEILASLLTAGNSQKALEIILEEDRLDLLIDLMGREEFTVRLGAMVVMEELQEKWPEKISSLVPNLIKLLESGYINIRGDTAFMLGKIGDQRAVEPLKRLLSEQNQDLVEITREALGLLSEAKLK